MKRRLLRWLPAVAALLIVVPLVWLAWSSRLPPSYDAAAMGHADFGGGSHHDHAWSHRGTAVSTLTADPARPADVSVVFHTAQRGHRFTVNGSTPGPVLRATVGDLVEVRLVNDSIRRGTTLHWHGIDVPNAMDGVAGVTQDVVPVGGSFTYRWVAERAGTYWYHAHQVSHEQVRGGLLGAVVISPATADATVVDDVAVLHRYGTRQTVNGRVGQVASPARPGDTVRVRVINTDNALTSAWVSGASYRLVAVDGTDLHEPDLVSGKRVQITAGGRADLLLTVPEAGARVSFAGGRSLLLGGLPGVPAVRQPKEAVDLLTYGTPLATDLARAAPDRTFRYDIGRRPGFLDGKPGWWWTINGRRFPDVPMFMVAPGDVVHMRISNHSGRSHPMHLHGHRLLVLARDGTASRGSPWWTDSLEVADGATYDVAFTADNPGIWMDHCHNLPHAAEGLVAHLMYMGVRSSYRISGRNQPE